MKTADPLDPHVAALLVVGERAQREERYDEAARCYRGVLAEAKRCEPARFNLAVTQVRRGHAAEAVELFEQLLGPEWRDAWRPGPVEARPWPSRLFPLVYNLGLAYCYVDAPHVAVEAARAVVLQVVITGLGDDAEVPPRRFLERLEGPACALLAVAASREAHPPRRRGDGDELGRSPGSDEAAELVEALHDLTPHDERVALLAARLARERHGHDGRTQYLLACYGAWRGAHEEALEELEEALRKDTGSISWARRDPLLEPLRRADRREFRDVVRWARLSAGGRD